MKKFVASVGLVALGASTLHAAETATLDQNQKTKNWSVAATLRGFYDDNITGTAFDPTESLGAQLTVPIRYGSVGEQSSFNAGYSFTARYFDKQAPDRTDKDDFTHTFDLDYSHAFSPRTKLLLSEAFVIGQEPDLIRDYGAVTKPIEGDNIRNFFDIGLNQEFTDLFGLGFGYKNGYYDYDDEGAITSGPVVVAASNSGLYDRMEHLARLDTRWKLSPQTTGIIGYNYGQTDYQGDEQISGDSSITPPGAPGAAVYSDYRDSQTHTIYVGGEHTFNNNLAGTLLAGGQFTDYVNDPTDPDGEWSPYLQASLDYALETRTTLSLGLGYNRTAANEAGGGGSAFIRDAETANIYGSVRHALASKFFVTCIASAQNSAYNAPGSTFYDDEHYAFYRFGVDFAYEFNPNLSASLGYNYDELASDIPGRDYDRNRVYVGLTAGF